MLESTPLVVLTVLWVSLTQRGLSVKLPRALSRVIGIFLPIVLSYVLVAAWCQGLLLSTFVCACLAAVALRPNTIQAIGGVLLSGALFSMVAVLLPALSLHPNWLHARATANLDFVDGSDSVTIPFDDVLLHGSDRLVRVGNLTSLGDRLTLEKFTIAARQVTVAGKSGRISSGVFLCTAPPCLTIHTTTTVHDVRFIGASENFTVEDPCSSEPYVVCMSSDHLRRVMESKVPLSWKIRSFLPTDPHAVVQQLMPIMHFTKRVAPHLLQSCTDGLRYIAKISSTFAKEVTCGILEGFESENTCGPASGMPMLRNSVARSVDLLNRFGLKFAIACISIGWKLELHIVRRLVLEGVPALAFLSERLPPIQRIGGFIVSGSEFIASVVRALLGWWFFASQSFAHFQLSILTRSTYVWFDACLAGYTTAASVSKLWMRVFSWYTNSSAVTEVAVCGLQTLVVFLLLWKDVRARAKGSHLHTLFSSATHVLLMEQSLLLNYGLNHAIGILLLPAASWIPLPFVWMGIAHFFLPWKSVSSLLKLLRLESKKVLCAALLLRGVVVIVVDVLVTDVLSTFFWSVVKSVVALLGVAIVLTAFHFKKRLQLWKS